MWLMEMASTPAMAITPPMIELCSASSRRFAAGLLWLRPRAVRAKEWNWNADDQSADPQASR